MVDFGKATVSPDGRAHSVAYKFFGVLTSVFASARQPAHGAAAIAFDEERFRRAIADYRRSLDACMSAPDTAH